MTKNKQNVPQVRFKGFTDDWEQRGLGECFDERAERSAEGELIAVTINSGVVKASELNRHDNSSEDKSNYKVVRKNDIAYNSMRMWQGASGYSQYDGILSPAYTVAIPKENIDSVFFSYLFKCTDMIYQFQINSQGLTSDTWNLKFPAFSKIKVNVPKLEEQSQIGSYFHTLDHLITLHQRKYDKLQVLKKAMLEKMFPKNGSHFPEIRFKGFTDAWELRELGEVFVQTSNYVNPKEDNIELWSLTVEEGLVPKTERYTRDFLVKKEDKFKEVRTGDIVYNPMNMTLGAIGYNNTPKSIAVSGYYVTMVANSNTDPYFINTWLKSPQAILTYKNYATGSLKEKQRIQFPTLSIISVPFPKLEEQQQIGTYFRNLDHLITLHQRKLETLKKLKKAMLQKMFI